MVRLARIWGIEAAQWFRFILVSSWGTYGEESKRGIVVADKGVCVGGSDDAPGRHREISSCSFCTSRLHG